MRLAIDWRSHLPGLQVYRRGTRLGLDLYALFTSILCFAKGRDDGTPDAAGGGSGRAFAGHYVVLCGVDTVAQTVHLADPASRAPLDMLAASVFEEARHSFGTDDDVILIPAVAPVS